MKAWDLTFSNGAKRDLKNLNSSQRNEVLKSINKVLQNPLPSNEGGYGKPLGNKMGLNLSGCLKIKLKASGLRVVYRLIRTEAAMQVIVIGLRADEEVYKIAYQRLQELKMGKV